MHQRRSFEHGQGVNWTKVLKSLQKYGNPQGSRRFKAGLMGTPIDLSGLTQPEHDALLADAKGMWADHPDIKDPVKWVRELREGLSKRF